MKKEQQYFLYDLKEGRSIRGVVIEGRHWFIISDFFKGFRLNTPKSIRPRLMLCELAYLNIDGQRYRCVSLTGLLSLLPLKSEYARERGIVIDMIKAFPEPKGLPGLYDHPNLMQTDLKLLTESNKI